MNFIGNRYDVLNIDENIKLNKMYEARDIYENKKVLIKLIEHNNYIDDNFILNLIDEATVLNEIDSPYILKNIDIGVHCTEYSMFYYIVSEYFEGITLESLIKGNYLHLEAIINITTQIVKALECINDNKMYHGDLNPANIIIDKNHNVKVCNVGMIKANKGVHIRCEGKIKYLSPHQLCINYTDIESDYFALGLMLFESIFKKLPYKEYNNEERLLRSIDKGIKWENLKATNGNDKLISIIKRLLNRKEKYTNTQQILIELSSIMYEKAEIKNEMMNKEVNVVIDKKTMKNTNFLNEKNRFLGLVGLISIIVTIMLGMI